MFNQITFGRIVFGLFEFTFKLQKKIDLMSDRFSQSHKYIAFQRTLFLIGTISFILTLISTTFYNAKAVLFFAGIMCVCLYLGLTIDTIVNFKLVLVSVRKFLSVGIVFDIVITIIVYYLSTVFGWDKTITSGINSVLPVYWHGLFGGGVVISFVIFGVIWFLFSILANSKVATTANAIIAAGLAILLTILNSIWCFFSQDYPLGFSLDVVEALKSFGYSPVQLFQAAVSLFTVPPLIINCIAMLLAQLKGYWVEKYNDGQEISDIKTIENTADIT